ncbi:MAG: NADH-quinone oxidoreductase subunit N [Paludibacteraceae bacterium]|nr:NADH-quinone oxidoreductase subunit N [Paludibacteraceae bacterium]
MDYSQFLLMTPEVSLALTLIVLLVADLVMGEKSKQYFQPLALVLFAAHTAYNFCSCSGCCTMVGQTEAFSGMYITSNIHVFVKNMLNLGTLLVFLFSFEWNKKENKNHIAEFYLLMISTLFGMYLMISSGDFLLFYIGLETASIPMATLVALNKKRNESAEAAAKYILTAAFSSAVMLFGISLVYGSCGGSLYFCDVAKNFTAEPFQILAMIFFMAGVAFKISLVPFHLWTADTYQGAPTSVTAYLSVMSKGSAAFAFMVIMWKAFSNVEVQSTLVSWTNILWWLIVITITVGNIFAIRQKNLKRFLAFSSISQAGYIMLGLMSGTAAGMGSMVYYILVYLFTNLGAFGIISNIEDKSGKVGMDDYNGLYETNPKMAVIMMLAMFSLAGIPPFAGFWSKFFIFASAAQAGQYLLVFIALANTIISLYYYLLVVKAMFINKSDSPIATFKSDKMSLIGITVCTVGFLFLGFISQIYEQIIEWSFRI